MYIHKQQRVRNTLIVLTAFIGGIVTTVLASIVYAAGSQSLADSLLSKIEDKVTNFSTIEKLAYFNAIHADMPAMIAALTAVDAKLVEKINTIKNINDASSSTLGDLVDSTGIHNDTTTGSGQISPSPADKIITIKVGNSGWACGNPESNNFTTYSQSYLSGGTVKVNVTYCSSKGGYIWNNTCSNGRENMTRLTDLKEDQTLTCPPIAPPADKIVTIKVGKSVLACGDPYRNDYTTYYSQSAADGTVTVNITNCLTKGNYVWNKCGNNNMNKTPLTDLTEGMPLTCPPIAPPPADKIITIKVGNSGWACGNPESNNFTTYSQSYLSGGTVKVNVTYCSSKGGYIWNNTCSNGRENMTRLTDLKEDQTLTCPPIAPPPVPTISVTRTCDGIACTDIKSSTKIYTVKVSSTNIDSLSYICTGPQGSAFINKKFDIAITYTHSETGQKIINDGWIAGKYDCIWTGKKGSKDVITFSDKFSVTEIPIIDTSLSFTLKNGPTFRIGDTVTVDYAIGTSFQQCGIHYKTINREFGGSSGDVYVKNPVTPRNSSYTFSAFADLQWIKLVCVYDDLNNNRKSEISPVVPITINYFPEIIAMFAENPYTRNKPITVTNEHITNWTNEIKAKGLGAARTDFPGAIKAWACGRDPEDFYLTYHPDVKAASVQYSVSGWTHYDKYGRYENPKREACSAWN